MLIVLAIAATFVLTRGLVAPMHRLMRAARSVGAGKLDVFVPASSSDELGLLTHTFNHMTQRLAESQAEVGNYQRTLEEKVVQRTQGARGRDRARVQARAARHPHWAAESGAPQSAAEADPRAVAAKRRARRLPVPRFRSLQADQRHAGPRCGRSAAAGRRAAAHGRGARIRHGRPARRRRIRRHPSRSRSRARDVRDDDGARARARVVPRAVPPRRPDAHAHLLDRRLDVPARCRGHRHADQAGRHGDVRREGSRPQRVPVLHGGHERARPGAAAARDGHAARAVAERVLPRLSAADRHAHRPALRRRGAPALARSRARRDRADGVHTRSPRNPG